MTIDLLGVIIALGILAVVFSMGGGGDPRDGMNKK